MILAQRLGTVFICFAFFLKLDMVSDSLIELSNDGVETTGQSIGTLIATVVFVIGIRLYLEMEKEDGTK